MVKECTKSVFTCKVVILPLLFWRSRCRHLGRCFTSLLSLLDQESAWLLNKTSYSKFCKNSKFFYKKLGQDHPRLSALSRDQGYEGAHGSVLSLLSHDPHMANTSATLKTKTFLAKRTKLFLFFLLFFCQRSFEKKKNAGGIRHFSNKIIFHQFQMIL